MPPTNGSLIQLYLNRKGSEVYMLKSALTEAGFWIGQPPAISLRPVDKVSLANCLNEALAAPTACVPTPSRDAFPTPIDLGIPYKKSWRSLHKDFDSVSISSSTTGLLTVSCYQPDGLLDEAQTREYSGPDAFAAVVDNIADRIGTIAHH